MKIITSMNDNLLKEFVELLVENNDSFQYNVNKIYNDPNLFFSLQYILPETITNISDIKDLLSQVTPLQKNKIVDIAGEGATALALILDNDHVLKLMMHNHTTKIAFSRYKNFINNVYSGKGSLKDIFIYNLGEAKSKNKNLYWIDMMKLKTLRQWVSQQEEDYSWLLDGIYKFGKTLETFKGTSIDALYLLHDILSKYANQSNKQIITSIVETYINMLKTFNNYGPDFHAGNIGVIEHEDKAPTFVMFDF